MRVWYKDKQAELRLVDKGVAGFEGIPDNSIDSIVTDPPYHLYSIVKRFGKEDAAPAKFGTDGVFQRASKGFMGKEWDGGDVSYDPATWAECLRVLKPGGHMLCFGGSRTFHRIAVAIEDAGFELRDTVMWVYGSGFPKSHNVGKAITALEKTGKSCPQGLREARMGENYKPTGQEDYRKGRKFSSEIENDNAPTELTDNGKQWEGWGSALKPAFEPIILARKPLDGTIAGNALKWGVGGINIDGCRVALQDGEDISVDRGDGAKELDTRGQGWGFKAVSRGNQGRWPANFIHDGSEEVLALMPDIGGGSYKAANARVRNNGIGLGTLETRAGSSNAPDNDGDSGSAARFFMKCEWDGGIDTDIAARFNYCAKASKNDRDEGCEDIPIKTKVFNGQSAESSPDMKPVEERFTTQARNHHPTVKPTSLMRYLCRLITPPNGLILDPFMGSGSTGKAAILEGFRFMGLDITEEYMPIAEARVKWAEKNVGMGIEEDEGEEREARKDDGVDSTLF